MEHYTRKTPDEPEVKAAALKYAAIGLAVFPIWRPVDGVCSCRKGDKCEVPGKHPKTSDGFRSATIDESKINRWKWGNIGIATGPKSGIVVIDIDTRNGGMDTYRQFAKELGELHGMPYVETSQGGAHLYFEHPNCTLRGTAGSGIDIKASGGYVVAPPSLHITGHVYTWKRSTNGSFPPLPPAWVEFLRKPEVVTQTAQTYTDIPDNSGHESRSAAGRPADGPQREEGIDEYVKKAIESTIPRAPGERHKGIFRFAAALQGHPELARGSIRQLRPYVNAWYAAACKVDGVVMAANADENWHDFAEGWGHVRYPGTGGRMTAIMERASKAIPAAADFYSTDALRLLVSLCRELQREAGDKPFPLSTRKVAELFGVDAMRASRWLRGIERDGFIKCEKIGTLSKRQASEWRYLPPIDE